MIIALAATRPRTLRLGLRFGGGGPKTLRPCREVMTCRRVYTGGHAIYARQCQCLAVHPVAVAVLGCGEGAACAQCPAAPLVEGVGTRGRLQACEHRLLPRGRKPEPVLRCVEQRGAHAHALAPGRHEEVVHKRAAVRVRLRRVAGRVKCHEAADTGVGELGDQRGA